MPLPLIALPIALPADAFEVRAGDVDADGRDDLIVVSRTPRPGAPATVTLSVLTFTPTGTLASRRALELGDRPLLWDADRGLWGVDREGLVRLDPTGGPPTRLAKLPTALTALGPTSPVWAPLAHELDGDAIPELLVWSAGRYHGFRTDGTSFGSIPAPAEGHLDTDWSTGAASTRATLSPPAVAVADVDGDGKSDLLLPKGAELAVYFTEAALGARAATLRLPLDLEPPDEDPKPGETRRRVSGVWLEDLDGDGRCDLGVLRLILNGSWFGATSELSWAKGRGDSFEPLRATVVGAATFGVELVDADGDGDKDFVAPVADIGIGTLARALVTQSVRVDLSLFRMEGGQVRPPIPLRGMSFPIESPDRLQGELKADLDGDGRVDLVTNDGADVVRVYRGAAGGVESTAAWELAMPVPLSDDPLFVHDVTGDGRAEIFVWGPGARSAVLLRVP